MPTMAQAIVDRPAETARARCATTPSNAGWSSPGAASSRRSATRRPGRSPSCRSRPRRAARSSTRASSRARRLPDLYPDLRAPLSLGYAVFHQRYATNTRPVWRLAQPFRSIAHNGEINTVRGNREQVRGRTGDRGARPVAATSWPPARSSRRTVRIRSPSTRPSSCSRRPAGSSRRPCSPRSPRRSGCAARPIRTSPRSAAARRGSSRRGTGRRRSSSPTACASARSSTATASGRRRSPSPATGSSSSRPRRAPSGSRPSETIRRGRLGPGELLLVEPGRRLILEDTDAKARALRALPIHDEPRPVVRGPRRGRRRGARARGAGPDRRRCATSRASMPSGPASTSRRWPSRGTSRSGAWATTRRRPGRARLDRPVADHLRQAFAQVTNPAIDPERERIVLDLRVELGRRPALLGGPPRGPRTLRLARPIVADLDGLLAAAADGGPACPPARRDLAPGRRSGRTRGAARSHRPRRRVRPPRRASRSSSSPIATSSFDRLPVPSILARRGRPHRPDRCRAPRPHRPRGRRRRRPRRPRDGDDARGRRDGRPSAARDRARRRAGGHARRRDASRRPTAIDSLMSAFEAGLRKTLARMGISAVASYIGGSLIDVVDLDASVVARCFPTAAAWPGRTTLADLAERQLRRRAAAAAIAPPAPGREPRFPDPGFARFRADGEVHLFAPKIATRDHDARHDRRPRGHRRRARALPDGARARGLRPGGPARRAARRPARRAGRRSTRSRTRARSCAASSSRR